MWLPFAAAKDACNETSEAGEQRVATEQPVAKEHGVAAFELMLVALVVGLVAVIIIPTLLRPASGANNTDAQANLRNAIVEAEGAYGLNQSYSYHGSPLSTLSFASAAPAFSWTTGSCAGQGPACVSEQVVDVDMPGDSQGVVLATWSSMNRTCWYAVDLETVPRVLSGDTAGRAFEAASARHSFVSHQGVYFARSAGTSSCSATSALSGSGSRAWSPT